MGKVAVDLSMSLDGYITGPNDNPEQGLGEGGMRLFAWLGAGDTPFQLKETDPAMRVSAASATIMREEWPTYGAFVTGRRTFDIAHAWGGNPPLGLPTWVVTHGNIPQEWVGPDSPFTFVTDGIASAIAQAKAAAGEKNVSVVAASLVQQALSLGLLDEININLVPVLLGAGRRLFDHLGTAPVELEQVRVVETPHVTHLRYRVVTR
jgi:dihydrofolate reductase